LAVYNAAGLELTRVPSPELAEQRRIGRGERPRLVLDRFLRLAAQLVAARLARLERAFSGIRASIDPGWVAVALVVAVMLGGFTWLFAEVRRLEAKVDAVSLRIAEMPSTLEGDLQAQTDRLRALVSAQRQSGVAVSPGAAVTGTSGAGPAPSQPQTTNGSHALSSLPRSRAAGASGASMRAGATADATNTKVANSSAAGGAPHRP
jgi:hypothetical protein